MSEFGGMAGKHCATLVLDVRKAMGEEGLILGKDALALWARSMMASAGKSEMGLVLWGATGVLLSKEQSDGHHVEGSPLHLLRICVFAA